MTHRLKDIVGLVLSRLRSEISTLYCTDGWHIQAFMTQVSCFFSALLRLTQYLCKTSNLVVTKLSSVAQLMRHWLRCRTYLLLLGNKIYRIYKILNLQLLLLILARILLLVTRALKHAQLVSGPTFCLCLFITQPQ